VPFFVSTQQARAERLSRLDRFGGLTPKDIRLVVKAAELGRVKRNERVTAEGADATGLYVVLSGTLHVAQDGQHVRTLHAGDLVGEIGALSGSVSTASVRADSESEVLFFAPDLVTRLCDEVPGFREALQLTAGERLQADLHRE
jgi:CRP/FNR family cyclic AMP-dependent transcriptional regulator